MLNVDPIKMPLQAGPGGSEERLKRFLKKRVRGLKDSLRDLHTNRVTKWRKLYEAVPALKQREFPFHNASNLVVPIIAIHSDALLARVMAAVFKTKPLWVAKVAAGATAIKEIDGLREAIETFLGYVGMESTELDLYRVYHEWFGETIRLGTSTVKSPWERLVEDFVTAAGDGSGNFDFDRKVTYEGPRPEKIPFEDFLISPYAKTVDSADFKAHKLRLSRQQLEERAFRKIYDSAKVKEVLKQPDLMAPDEVQSQKESDAGTSTSLMSGFIEYHIHECWFKYQWGNKWIRCIVWYHERSETILRAFFSYYPDEPFVTARLFFRDDFFFGYGFCETLEMLQEEISQIHNQRRDNATVANMKMFVVDPDSKLHNGYRAFPSAFLPAAKDEFIPVDMGTPNTVEIDSERLSLELAEKRSGVNSPTQGSGAGTMNKRGVYSAMGTLALLQEGNTRTDLNITDIKYAHTKLGRLIAHEFAEFGGIGEERVTMMGDIGVKVEQALEALKEKKIVLPVYASTASVNREVEKQNDLLFTNVMQKHYGTVTQMLQMLQNPMADPNSKSYVADAIKASETLMKIVSRHFGYDEVDRLVPTAATTAPQGGPQPSMPGQPGAGQPPGAAPQLPPGMPPNLGMPPGGRPM